MKNSIAKALLGAAIAVAGLVGVVQPAHAIVIAGSWDPAWGGGKFVGLGWNATAQFDVPTACLAINGNHLNDGSDACTGGAGEIAFNGVINVNFYHDPNTASIFETHTFNISAADIVSIDILGGQVTGITTNALSSSLDPGTTTFYTVNFYNFDIWFNGTSAYMNAYAQYYYNDPQNCSTEAGCMSGGATGSFAFAEVPEPGSLALLAGALAGLGVVRRRRTQ